MHPRWLIAIVALVAIGFAAAGELADIYLKNGLRLRGEVTDAGDHITLRNQAGSADIPKTEIDKIVPVNARPRAATQPAAPPATSPATVPAAAPSDSDNVDDAPDASPAATSRPGMAAPPLLGPKDMLRLKLSELTLDGPAEELAVKFPPGKQRRDVTKDVLTELQKRPDYDREWERILTRGKPSEKLQLIVRETRLEYLDRIELNGDPAVFANFRRRVMPLVTNGCMRSGCHGSVGAEAFRFPAGAKDSDATVYTTFVFLERLRIANRPLIDRIDAANAPLLKLFIGISPEDGGHPAVPGKKLNPPLKSTRDPQYAALVAWLNSLRNPHPDYQLEYEFSPLQRANNAEITPPEREPARKSP